MAFSFLSVSSLQAISPEEAIKIAKEQAQKGMTANVATPTQKKKKSNNPSYSMDDVSFNNTNENLTTLNNGGTSSNNEGGEVANMDAFDEPSETEEKSEQKKEDTPKKKSNKQTNSGNKGNSKDNGNTENLVPKKKFVYKIPIDAYRISLKADNTLKILADKVVVITFPFLITNVQSGAFIPKDKDKKLDTRIKIEVEDNKLFVSSKIGGDIDLLLQGGDYPVMLHLDIYNFNEKDKEVNYRYFAFEKSKEEVLEEKKPTYRLMTETHEENIIQLNKALYYDLKLKGFKVVKNTEKFDVPSVGISLTREKTISGMGYVGEKWIIKNIGEGRVKLSEEAFFREGTYSIWLENTYLDQNKTSRMFIIRKL